MSRQDSVAQKYYVVWAGRQTGVFSDWATTRSLVDKFAGARYKSFPTRSEAELAFRAGKPARTVAASKSPTVRTPAADDAAKFDLQIYCDGACEPNPGNAGSGMAIYRGGVVSELWYGLYNPTGTNNTAELNALHQALLFAEQAIGAGMQVQILSDSKYAISCIGTWATGWERKGWKKTGGDIKNLDIIKTAFALYSTIEPQLTMTHVSAHVGTEGNELADRMAMYAVLNKCLDFRRYDQPIDVPSILRMRAG
jgi:ribonuclease HI